MVMSHGGSTPRKIDPQDIQGTPISAGDLVVYNKSGEMAIGTILEIRKFKYEGNGLNWFYLRCFIKVQQQGTDHISKIRNPQGIISLKSIIKSIE